MAEDDIQQRVRRSSSETSSSSRRSQKANKTIRLKQKRHSASSEAGATDLTSFPSLSPDRSPDGFVGQPALNRALTNALLDGENNGTDSASDVSRGRRATLAKLTSAFPQGSGRAALFDDSYSTHDIPGALHLADDAHIERLLTSVGPVKLVRQFARDLAQRDAEISALRQRADARERELKRMLREVSISNQDIERRLYVLENNPENNKIDRDDTNADQAGQSVSPLNGLMQQAMTEGVGARLHEDLFDDPSRFQSTVRARLESDSRSGTSSLDSTNNPKRQNSRGWPGIIFGSTAGSRKTSRASSVMSDAGEVQGDTERPRIPSTQSTTARRKVLDEQLFQPPDGPTGPAEGPVKRRIGAPANGDDASIHSRKSSKSLSSWAAKLFAGGSQNTKDDGNSDTGRSRASSSADQTQNKGGPSTLTATKGAPSAVAALSKLNSNSSTPGGSVRTSNGTNRQARSNTQIARRSGTISGTPAAGENTDKSATNLGPVEMDAILPMESRPPTLTHTYNNYQPGDLLTDRFGFIYDQRRKKRQREANVDKNGNRMSAAETLSSFRNDTSDGEDDPQLPSTFAEPRRSPTLASFEDTEAGSSGTRRWQDYLRIPSRPTELLSHTPSAGPIISLATAGDSDTPSRSSAVSVDKSGSVSVSSNSQPSASTSTIVADRPEFSGTYNEEPANAALNLPSNENEPVKLLLEQLTDLHDSLQRDRTVRWNEFLRKVRAERRKDGEVAAAAAAAADRPLQSVDMPEVTLADGEVVGVAGLGNKGKVGRAKWREFRSLVLGGIPVALRAKVWSECSGASAMRVPGYYDDLVKGVGGSEPDSSVVAQIDMDIYRTLTDNVFFRKGPGAAKLKEVLLAYSRRNPEVGYCQGMNLIAASLLLIMPTAEDAFWILSSMIEIILPQHYYDHGLLASRADQVVLRQYISQVLPRLSAHLEELGIELEALTFQWFLSVFTDCLSAEALYRVWDVVLCLNVTSTVNANGSTPLANRGSSDPSTSAAQDIASGSGGGSTFLFQVALALLKLNEQQLLTTCDTPAALYTYINHQMTNHAISIDGLIQASEGLRNVVRREDVVARRVVALKEMREFSGQGESEA